MSKNNDPILNEVPLAPQAALMFPGIIEELGLDQLKPSIMWDDNLAGRDLQQFSESQLTANGVAFEGYKYIWLPPKKDLVELGHRLFIRDHNDLLMHAAGMQRGLKLMNTDDFGLLGGRGQPFSHPTIAGGITRDTLEDRPKTIVFGYPGKRDQLRALDILVAEKLGGSITTHANVSERLAKSYRMPNDKILDMRDISQALDMALQEDQFQDLRDIADAHRTRIMEKARAQRRGNAAIELL